MYKILIVEDDPTIAGSLSDHLRKWGYETAAAPDFQAVMQTFAHVSPHLILMDIGLPFFNGYYWCSEIRKLSHVPIIFVSSAADNMNIVMAVNMGADDFVAKPFDMNVLVAKIQALLRRTYSFTGQSSVLEHKGAILNISDGSVVFHEKKTVLTKNELRILQFLMENVGSVLSRDAIMLRLWEGDSYVDDNTLTVNVTRLRKKLDETGLADFIITRKGEGYLIE